MVRRLRTRTSTTGLSSSLASLSPVGYLLGNDFRSWYHSFQTQVTKRFSKGVTVLASYTLSKSIDSSSTDNLGATVANPFNLRDERGRSDWDRRHAFVASWLWSPQPNISNGFGRFLFRDWTITGIHTHSKRDVRSRFRWATMLRSTARSAISTRNCGPALRGRTSYGITPAAPT